jgi:hypothetical protein
MLQHATHTHIVCIVHVYDDTRIQCICSCLVFSVCVLHTKHNMDLFHETSLANASHQDGDLSFSSSDFDVLVALRRWDMPLEAYPKISPFAQSCGVSTSYKLRFCTEASFYVVGGDITVHLLMQAFVIPGGNADYYSFWNARDFPGHALQQC